MKEQESVGPQCEKSTPEKSKVSIIKLPNWTEMFENAANNPKFNWKQKWIVKSLDYADQENPAVLFARGRVMMLSDSPVEQAEAPSYFERAINKGFVRAYYWRGRCSDLGCGCPKSSAEAVAVWWTKGDVLGDVASTVALAACYLYGTRASGGIVADGKQAFSLASRAASKDSADGKRLLAECLIKGVGCPRDFMKAGMLIKDLIGRKDVSDVSIKHLIRDIEDEEEEHPELFPEGRVTEKLGLQSRTEAERKADDEYVKKSWGKIFAETPGKAKEWSDIAYQTEFYCWEYLCSPASENKYSGIKGCFRDLKHAQIKRLPGELVHVELRTDLHETVSSTNSTLRYVGTGSLFCTNKRFVFVNGANVKSIPYSEISAFDTDWLPEEGRVSVSVINRARMLQFGPTKALVCGWVYKYYSDPLFKGKIDVFLSYGDKDVRRHGFVKEMLDLMLPAVEMRIALKKLQDAKRNTAANSGTGCCVPMIAIIGVLVWIAKVCIC